MRASLFVGVVIVPAVVLFASVTTDARKSSSASSSLSASLSVAPTSSSPAKSSHGHLSPMEILAGEQISPSALHRAALADSSNPPESDTSSLALASPSPPLLLSKSPGLTVISPKRYTFTQGFLLGQFLFVIMCAAFIKYVVFEDAESGRRRRAERVKQPPLSTTNVPPPSPGSLLEKVGYDMSTHGSESAEWMNVLFGQVLQGYRDDLLGAGGEEGARRTFEKWLNPKESTISWLDPITVTSLSLGNSYPLLSNARIRPADGQGNLRSEVDLDYTDSVHLSLATSVLVNFPRPRFAVLPVALGIELVGFGGTMTMQIHKTPSADRDRWQQIHLSLLPDFHLNVKASSLLGSRAKLQDIPKLEQIVISRLQAAIQERVVWPRFVGVSLPRLVSAGREAVVSDSAGGAEKEKAGKQVMAQVVVNGRPLDRVNGNANGGRGEKHSGGGEQAGQPDTGRSTGRTSGNQDGDSSGLASLSLGRDELFSPPLISVPGIVTSRQTSKFMPPDSGGAGGGAGMRAGTPSGLGIAGATRNVGSSIPGTPGVPIAQQQQQQRGGPSRTNTSLMANTSSGITRPASPESSGYPNGAIPLGPLQSSRSGGAAPVNGNGPGSAPGSSYGFPRMSVPATGMGESSASASGSATRGNFGPEDILRYRSRGPGTGTAAGSINGGSVPGTPSNEGGTSSRMRGALNSRARDGVVR